MSELKRTDGVFVPPVDTDAQWCLVCGQDALDTGWECTNCGTDCMPFYNPEGYARMLKRAQQP